MFVGLLSAWTIGRFSASLAFYYEEPIKCLSLNNQPCKARPTTNNINFGKTLFCPFNVSVNMCGRSCYTIDDSCARVCVTNKVKYMNVKVFNLISVVNKTRFLVEHASCECKCGLNEGAFNSKKR